MELYQGSVAPDAYPLRVFSGDSGLDMTTVTNGVIVVLKPDGTIVTWAAVISGALVSELTLTHNFSPAPSDLDLAGEHVFYALLTVPGGYRASTRIRRNVRGVFEVP